MTKAGISDGEVVHSGKRGLAVDGGTRVRVRRQKKPAWTRAKEKKFLETLAETCNVLLSAKAAKVRPQRAYDRRAKDAAFRASWDRALAEGYAQLEMMMLERALHGVEKTIVLKSGETSVMREYNDRTALALLRMHRETAATASESVDREDYQEACERIISRLERLREREEGAEGELPVETKGARDSVALIGWGIARRGAPIEPGARTGPLPSQER
jgi:hypothetical protein